MATLDDISARMEQIASAVRENKGTTEGLRKDELLADLKGLLDEQRALQQAEAPVRPGEFQGAGVERALENYKGRYSKALHNINRHGYHQDGAVKYTASDYIMAKIMIDRANAMKQQNVGFNGVETVRPASEDLNAAVKALTSTGSATGDELVPTGMAGELWNDFFVASRIAADLQQMPMPTDPFDIPLNFGDITWRKGTQNISTTATDMATAKSTLTSTEQVAEVDWSYSLDEDSVVAVMPAIRARLAISGAEQFDAFVLNADSTNAATGNINSDDGNPPDDSYYLSDGQDGIRHLALVDNTSQNSALSAAITDAGIATTLGKLAKYGLDYANVRLVPGVETYLTMLGMTNVATVDKYGAWATLVRGELARYRGIPVIPSASMEKVEADGKKSVTAASNTKGALLAYNRNMWTVGFRRGLMIEVDRLIQKRQLVMVVSFRIAVGAYGTRSTATHTALLRDLTI